MTARPLWIVLLLGLNCWVATVALPAWHLASVGRLSTAVIVSMWVALVALIVGVVLLSRRHRAGPLVLAGVFPVLAVVPAAIQPTLARGSVMSVVAVSVAGVSFVSYLVGACWASGLARVQEIDAVAEPLDGLTARTPKVLRGGLLVWAVLCAAVILASSHLRDLGAGASRLGMLSVVGLALWATVFFGIVGPALRHRRPWPLTVPSRGAAIVWLLVVLVGLVMLAFALRE